MSSPPPQPATATSSTLRNQSQSHPPSSFVQPAPQQIALSRLQFCLELSQCLADFVVQLLPTPEELAVKEDVRKLLERLIRTLQPESRLLSFGSTANGFSLRNSDMDLCCLIDIKDRPDASQLVQMVGELLERETKFQVKPLPHARIPIVKLSLNPSPGLPFGIACDIGFENRLALENTRLLMSYAALDPIRVRTLVLFLKVWSKRRKINSPYKGTLSSYGYVLLVIYFLVHVKNPPVLPNLQQIPPMRPISHEDTHLNGRHIWFFDDVDLLRQRWVSRNDESVAELLIDFFRYFSKDFTYNTGVASIRGGLIPKEDKGWLESESRTGRYVDLAQERNRLCIEDPFETDFNVARSVTREGLYVIRGEFMRAHRLLLQRSEKVVITIAQLCEERPDDIRPPTHTPLFTGPSQLASIPAQTPYPVGSGSQSLRRNEGAKSRDRLSPPLSFFEESRMSPVADEDSGKDKGKEVHNHNGGASAPESIDVNPAGPQVVTTLPPEHMAPKRSKWTSPPPPNADVSDVASFENRFEHGLEMATQSSSAREMRYTDPISTRYSGSEISEEHSDIETNPDEDTYSDIGGFIDSRSVVSYGGVEVSRQFSGTHSTGTRTPPLQIAQDLRHMHLDHRSVSPPATDPRLPPRHQYHRPPRLINASRTGSQTFDRAVSDSEPERGETSSRRHSRGDGLLSMLSASVPTQRNVLTATAPRQRTHLPRNASGSSSSSSYSYRPPPRISGAIRQPTLFPAPLISNPNLHTISGYTIYQPFLSPNAAPNMQNAYGTHFYPQPSFTTEAQRHLGLDTNNLGAPQSPISGSYSTQSSPLQAHTANEPSPTTTSVQQPDFPPIFPTIQGRALYSSSPTTSAAGQFESIVGINSRPSSARQLSPVAPNRPLPVRRSDSIQAIQTPKASQGPQSASAVDKKPESSGDASRRNSQGRTRASSISDTKSRHFPRH